MNTMLKRLISLVLCCVLVTGYLPVSAFATEAGETVAAVETEAATEPSVVAAAEEPAAETTEEAEPEEPGKPEGPEKPEKPEAPEKPEKPEKPEAPEKPEKPEKPEAPEKPGKPGEATVPETTEATVPVTEETVPVTEETVPVTEETVPENAEAAQVDGFVDLLEEMLERIRAAVTAALADTADEEFSEDALKEAQAYIDALTINNESNDPSVVVSNFKTHFTWDNEKRENSASYLYDWSYYNGVVFEGLEYLYEATGKQEYYDYVVEYMSSMINADGTWANCANNTAKQAAGYNAAHGADCYKTASLLMDLYEMTGDSRYLTMAATLYADLDAAAKSYSLPNAGNNYRHTWASDPSPDLWLDGLYMILPFRAEYAKHIGDTEELDLIVERMQWVSDNMYNPTKGLFYHAADSAKSSSGTYWLRSMGWYAAAMADVMDSMEGENLEAMKVQLKKMVDGMLASQNSVNGMWLNNMNADQSGTNPYETSGTALVCYAVMKAVNNGWLDEEYVGMVKLAFNGICENKLSNNNLTDICFKGVPGGSNSTYYDNEGKGVGPFIMLYAEILKYLDEEPEQPEPTEPVKQEIKVESTVEGEEPVAMTVSGVSAPVEAAALTEEDKTLLEAHEGIASYVAIDVTGTLAEGEQATFTVAIPEGWDADRVVGISVEDGVVKEIEGSHENGMFTFTVDHFSAKGIGETTRAAGDAVNSGTGNLVGGSTYTLDTNGVSANKNYLIVNTNTGTGYALTNNNGTADRTAVTINGSGTNRTITVDDDANIAWQFSGTTSGTVGNNGRYVYLDRYDNFALNNSGSEVTISNQNNGAYRIYRYSDSRYNYLHYNNGWTKSSTRNATGITSIYLYELTSSSAGGEVVFTINPAAVTVKPNGTTALTGTVTVGGETVELSNCTITWASSDISKATVANGTVTGVADGTANITATLTAVNGTALEENIVLTIPVTVAAKAVKSIKVNGSVGYVSKSNTPATVVKDAHDNDITVTVTYDDNTTDNIPLTVSMLDVATPNVKGEYEGLTVTYGDKTDSPFTLNVVDNPGENFPEYPEEGSVDVNKVIGDVSQFQDTGVAEVQLSTSGIPMKTYVDAVLTIDVSNSMSWKTNSGSKDYVADNKLVEVMTAVKDFAAILLEPNEDGTPSGNTITIVTFAGYDAENWNGSGNYVDSVRTLVTATGSVDVINAIANGTKFTAADTIQFAYVPANQNQNSVNNVTTTQAGSNRGDTNYDYAFWQTSKAVDAVKEANGNAENREVHVLFMTDGCASNYNDYYYRSNNVGYYYRPGTKTAYTYYAASNGTDWTNYIQNTLIQNNGGNKYAVELYGKIKNMYAVGFDMKYGSFSGLSTWDSKVDWVSVFNNIVSKSVVDEKGNGLVPVTNAADKETLKTFYTSLAHSIRQAATNAYFVDQMGASFDLQLGNYITKFEGTDAQTTIALNPLPAVKVMTYNIYKKSDIGKTVGGKVVTQAMVGQRYGDPTVVETVVFSADGTQAFSSADGYTAKTTTVNGVRVTDYTGTNILNDGVIRARNFWYNTTKETKNITLVDGSTYALAAESFYWNIGTISDKEFVLSYYVYLVNSAEGKAPAGTYPTNTEAILHYTNWLDNNVSQGTQSPVLAWKSASVYYGFYLVDSNGNPVVNQATGETGSFTDAVKVSNRVFYEEVMMNSQSGAKSELKVTTTVVPDEYAIYDKSAVYTVTVDSGNTVSGWKITSELDKNTTYVTDFHGTDSSNAWTEGNDSYSYTSTTVWFAVVWEPQALPDTVVIDYGLPVDITVLSNDMFGSAGTLTGIGLESSIPNYSGSQKYGTTHNANFGNALAKGENGLKYGTAAINGSKVRYTPGIMTMPDYERFAYEASYQYKGADGADQTRYYYNTITVIPATTIYYEDSFLTLTSRTWGTITEGETTKEGWVNKTDGSLWTKVANNQKVQAEDRPGEYSLADANNIYGYDAANREMAQYSLNGYAKATVDYDNSAVASFDFYGTGFDVISMTDNTTGTIFVRAYEYDDQGNLSTSPKFAYAVDTYYGYQYVDVHYTTVEEFKDGKWVTRDGWEVTDMTGHTCEHTLKDRPATADEGTKFPYCFTVPAWRPVNNVDNANSDKIYQVPVMKISDLPYGKYRGEITVVYDPALEHNTASDSYDFYLDAIRIYDPANDGAGNKTIGDAYVADHEGWPSYFELRDKILKAGSFDDVANGVLSENDKMTGLVFIDYLDNVGDANISDYRNYGPNNELYLAPGQRIAFQLSDVTKSVQKTGADGELVTEIVSIVDRIHLGIKSADGKTATYTITNIDKDNGNYYNPKTSRISTGTDMYYDLTAWRNDIIVISNTGDRPENGTNGIVSITNIKATYKENPNAAVVSGEGDGNNGMKPASVVNELPENEVTAYMTGSAVAATLRVLNSMVKEETPGVSEPVVPEVPEIPEIPEPKPVDVQLKEAVDAAKQLQEKDYTPATFKTLKTALKSAEKVLKNTKATEKQMEQALAKLNKAVDALERKPDTAALKDAVSAAKKLKEKDYIPNSFKAVTTARKAAEKLLKDKNATQAKVDQALEKLNAAVAALEAKPDTSALKSAVNAVKKLKEKNYTKESFKALTTARKAAEKVMKNKNANQIMVDEALENLKEALERLVSKAPAAKGVKNNSFAQQQVDQSAVSIINMIEVAMAN